MAGDLFLHEELLLLALKDEQGTPTGSMYPYALAGGILAELLLRERIDVESVKKKKFARLISNAAVGDSVIDECLGKLATAKRRADLQTWVGRFARTSKLKNRVAEGLCNRGILREAHGKLLLIFPRTTYPELDPGPEKVLMQRIHDAIFGDAQELDPRTVIVVSLANSSGILRTLFPNKELKARKARIDQIANGDLIGPAVQATIEAIQTAVMIAAIMPAITAATMHH